MIEVYYFIRGGNGKLNVGVLAGVEFSINKGKLNFRYLVMNFILYGIIGKATVC